MNKYIKASIAFLGYGYMMSFFGPLLWPITLVLGIFIGRIIFFKKPQKVILTPLLFAIMITGITLGGIRNWFLWSKNLSWQIQVVAIYSNLIFICLGITIVFLSYKYKSVKTQAITNRL